MLPASSVSPPLTNSTVTLATIWIPLGAWPSRPAGSSARDSGVRIVPRRPGHIKHLLVRSHICFNTSYEINIKCYLSFSHVDDYARFSMCLFVTCGVAVCVSKQNSNYYSHHVTQEKNNLWDPFNYTKIRLKFTWTQGWKKYLSTSPALKILLK